VGAHTLAAHAAAAAWRWEVNGSDLGVSMARAAMVVAVLCAVLGAVVFAAGQWLFTHVAIDVRWLP
jgi:hypothetical protein